MSARLPEIRVRGKRRVTRLVLAGKYTSWEDLNDCNLKNHGIDSNWTLSSLLKECGFGKCHSVQPKLNYLSNLMQKQQHNKYVQGGT